MTPLADIFADPVLAAALGLALGGMIGYLHFASLRRVTDLYLAGDRVGRALAYQLARLAILGAGLVILALTGAVQLLAGALGILIARQLVLRRAKRTA